MKINVCRICKNSDLREIVNLGNHPLSGVFPASKHQSISSGPLTLVKCMGKNNCGLVQLDTSYDLEEMYGLNYGYRSGLNQDMVRHLKDNIDLIQNYVNLKTGDTVVDIGSNDGTTLSFYPNIDLVKIGIDPTIKKFKQYYQKDIIQIDDFFSSKVYVDAEYNKAKIVTSFSMFYDLENPLEFAKQVCDILEDDGIWAFEQSYLPTMLSKNSYDTICHEHLEYYAFYQILYILNCFGMVPVDVSFNDTNGGSFLVIASKNKQMKMSDEKIRHILNYETNSVRLDNLNTYYRFNERIKNSKLELQNFLTSEKNNGKIIYSLGASTKGNTILQYCNLDSKIISKVLEINKDKLGKFTPGTLIEIVDEESTLNINPPDILLVLPWHFKHHFLKKFKGSGLTLVFPLPNLEIISCKKS